MFSSSKPLGPRKRASHEGPHGSARCFSHCCRSLVKVLHFLLIQSTAFRSLLLVKVIHCVRTSLKGFWTHANRSPELILRPALTLQMTSNSRISCVHWWISFYDGRAERENPKNCSLSSVWAETLLCWLDRWIRGWPRPQTIHRHFTAKAQLALGLYESGELDFPCPRKSSFSLTIKQLALDLQVIGISTCLTHWPKGAVKHNPI